MVMTDWKSFALEKFGYEIFTTFGADFDVADSFGASAVSEAFRRAFCEWRNEYRYLTELVLILNWKSHQHYEAGNMTLAKLYADLWSQADAWACDNLQGEELEYFYRTTD